MNKTSFWLSLIACLLGFGAFAEIPRSDYIVTQYTVNNGLPSTRTLCLFQDKMNYLWIGTSLGVSRFDGRNFVNFDENHGLSNDITKIITEDCEGNLIVGTHNGLNKFDGKSFHQIKLEYDSTYSLVIYHVTCQQETLYISTNQGLYLMNRDSVRKIQSKEHLKIIKYVKNSKGEELLATSKGVYKLSDFLDEPLFLKGNYILDLYCTSHECIAHALSGISYRIENDSISEYDILNSKHGFSATKTLRKDSLRYVIRSNHVVIYKDSQAVGKIDLPGVPDDNFITDLLHDREGNIWAASTRGLFRLKSNQIKKIADPNNQVRTLHSINKLSDGRILVGSFRKVFLVENGKLLEFNEINPKFLGSYVMLVKQLSENRYLVGESLTGYSICENNECYKIKEGVESNKVFCFTHSSDGSTWVGSEDLICKIVGEEIISYQGLPSTHVLSIIEKEGRCILGTNEGIYLFKEGNYTNKGTPTELKNRVVFDMVLLNDSTIAACVKGMGVILLKVKEDSLSIIKAINNKNGLGSLFPSKIVKSQNDVLWTMASNGIYKIENYFSAKPTINQIGVEIGMVDNNWVEGDLFVDANNTIWVAGSEGLVYFPDKINNASFLDNLIPHYIGIFSNKTGEMIRDFSALGNLSNFETTLGFKENSFQIHFNCVNLSGSSSIMYSWKIDGKSSTWTKPSSNNQITFDNLSPGRYTFRLKATIGFNSNFSNETVISVIIQKPFWMTWWFRSFVFLVFIAFASSIYLFKRKQYLNRLRLEVATNKKIAESKFMAFQARMNPHFIFNSLNAIQYFIIKNDKESTLSYVSRFAKLLRQVLDNSQQTSITVESEIQMIRSYLDMEILRFENKFEYSIEIDENFNPSTTEIPGMILQPFVENAIMHGLLHKKGKGFLKIEVKKENNDIACTISDNGIGRKKSAELNSKRRPNHKSHGTSNAIERLQILKNSDNTNNQLIETYDLYSDQEDTGTVVKIKLPII